MAFVILNEIAIKIFETYYFNAIMQRIGELTLLYLFNEFINELSQFSRIFSS